MRYGARLHWNSGSATYSGCSLGLDLSEPVSSSVKKGNHPSVKVVAKAGEHMECKELSPGKCLRERMGPGTDGQRVERGRVDK